MPERRRRRPCWFKGDAFTHTDITPRGDQEPSTTSSRTTGGTSPASRLVGSEQLGERVQDLPDTQLAVARADQRRRPRCRPFGPGASHAAGGARSSRGPRPRLAPTVSCRTSRAARSRRGRPRPRSPALAPGADRGRDRLLDLVGPVPAARAGRVPPVHRLIQPKPIASTPWSSSQRQPGVVARRYSAGRHRGRAGVLEPEFDVRGRVEQLALHDQRVTRRAQPLGDPVVPGPVTERRPSWRAPGTSRGRSGGRARPHDVLDHAVTGEPGVAVDQPLPVGEITNGGLVAIRSNRSPRTGSKNEPSRTSIAAATWFSAALNRAMPSARWLTSVATTRGCGRPGAAPGRRSRCRGRGSGRPGRARSAGPARSTPG